MNYLSNAFSLNMLNLNREVTCSFYPINACDVPLDCISVVGHPDTANVISSVLGREVAFNRCNLKIDDGDVLYVAQYIGPRLPEGTTELPEGATIQFFKVIPFPLYKYFMPI